MYIRSFSLIIKYCPIQVIILIIMAYRMKPCFHPCRTCWTSGWDCPQSCHRRKDRREPALWTWLQSIIDRKNWNQKPQINILFGKPGPGLPLRIGQLILGIRVAFSGNICLRWFSPIFPSELANCSASLFTRSSGLKTTYKIWCKTFGSNYTNRMMDS